MTYYTVSTNATGLVVREVRENDTTVYADREIAQFDSWEEAEEWAEAHDHEYWEEDEEEEETYLVARVKVGDGANHDIDVTDLMSVFLAEGEEAVKALLTDEDTYVHYVRVEEGEDWRE